MLDMRWNSLVKSSEYVAARLRPGRIPYYTWIYHYCREGAQLLHISCTKDGWQCLGRTVAAIMLCHSSQIHPTTAKACS